MILSISCAVLAAANLLKNPSFEDWPEGEPIPRHWKCGDPKATAPRVSRLYALGTDGQLAVRYTNMKQEESLFQDVPVTPGKFYNVTCDARCDVHMYGFEIFTHFVDKDGKSLGLVNRDSDNDEIGFTEPWTHLSQLNLEAPPKAAKIRVCLTSNDCWTHRSVKGTIDIDNVSVTESAAVVADRPVTVAPRAGFEVLAAELKPGYAEAGVLVRTGRDPVTFALRGESPISGGRVVVGGEKTFSVPANTERSLFLPLETADPETRLTVAVGGQAVWRRRFAKGEAFFRLDILDRYDIRKDTIFVPNDAWWFNNFPVQRTTNAVAGARLFFEVPETLEIRGVRYSDWGLGVGSCDHPLEKPLAVTPSVWNGVKTRIYELRSNMTRNNDPLLVMKSSLPEGAVSRVRGWLTWKGGRQVPQEFLARTVSFGRIKPFARMNSRMADMTLNWMEAVTDDPAREIPTLGYNALAIAYEPKGSKVRYDNGTKSYEEKLRAFVDAAKASGATWYFYTPNELSLDCWVKPNSWNNHAKMSPDPEAGCRNIDGDYPKAFHFVPPCLNYRGTNFLAEIKWILNCGAMKDFGVTWLALDWEYWTLPCYCDRCRKLFREEWCPQHGFGDLGDPRVFMRDELGHPKEAAAYWQFFRDSRGRFYVDFKKELDKGLDPKRTEWNSPYPGHFALSDWLHPRKEYIGGLDHFEWMFGMRHPKHMVDKIDIAYTNVFQGTSGRFVSSVSVMQGCELCYNDDPIAAYYNVFEAATLGMCGFEHFYSRIYEAMSQKYYMDGIRAIRPFEDVILDGTVTARGEGRDCLWRRVALKDEALYCVRNYKLEKPTDVSFEVTVAAPAAAYDCASCEKLADLKPGKNTVTLRLDGRMQCRLVYVGTRFLPRRAAVRETAPEKYLSKDGHNVLFGSEPYGTLQDVRELPLACRRAETVPGEAPSLLPEGHSFKLVWNDEFDGDRLDTSKWGYRTNFWGRDAYWLAKPEHKCVEVKDGKLHMKVAKLPNGQFVSAQLQTGELMWDYPALENPESFWTMPKRDKPKFVHRYGYYEARARLQQRPGWWSAFWMQSEMQGACIDARYSGIEHDIMESFYPGCVSQHMFHMSGYGADYHSYCIPYDGAGDETHLSHTLNLSTDEFHVFGFLWEPDGYTIYVDGRRDGGKVGVAQGEPVSQVPEFLLLTTECQWYRHNRSTGKPVGPLEETVRLGDDFVVDYVRVYDIVK